MTTTQQDSPAGSLPDYSEPPEVQRQAYSDTRRRITELRDRLYLVLPLGSEALQLVEELTRLHDNAEILHGRTAAAFTRGMLP